MVWFIRFSDETETVIVKTQGNIPYNDLPRQFAEAVELAQTHGTNLFLFDDTELHMAASTLDIYGIPKMMIAAGFPRSSRIAVVISPAESHPENYQFLETVGVNQGFRVKIFIALEQAYAWLME